MSDHEIRRPWVPMALDTVGTVSDIVLGGGGKLSINSDDSGDIRKPKGQE